MAGFGDGKKKSNNKRDLLSQSEIIENLTGGVYIVGLDDVKIKYTNSTFEKMFGYKPGEMIGKHASIVNAPTEEDPLETANKIMAVINRKGEWHGRVHNIKKNGVTFWSYANVSVFNHHEYGDVLVAVHTDVTEQKESEEKYYLLYEKSRDAIMLLDGETGKFTAGNPATLKIFGLKSEKDFINTHPGELSPKNQPDGSISMKSAQARIKEAIKKGSVFFEWKHKRFRGEEFWATVLLVKMKISGKDFIQATVRDINHEKEDEAKLKDKIEEMQKINKLMIGRELKMVELKKEIEMLKNKSKK
jgi:PAS domain S-box-containing protein